MEPSIDVPTSQHPSEALPAASAEKKKKKKISLNVKTLCCCEAPLSTRFIIHPLHFPLSLTLPPSSWDYRAPLAGARETYLHVCVRERERAGERERWRERDPGSTDPSEGQMSVISVCNYNSGQMWQLQMRRWEKKTFYLKKSSAWLKGQIHLPSA